MSRTQISEIEKLTDSDNSTRIVNNKEPKFITETEISVKYASQ